MPLGHHSRLDSSSPSRRLFLVERSQPLHHSNKQKYKETKIDREGVQKIRVFNRWIYARWAENLPKSCRGVKQLAGNCVQPNGNYVFLAHLRDGLGATHAALGRLRHKLTFISLHWENAPKGVLFVF